MMTRFTVSSLTNFFLFLDSFGWLLFFHQIMYSSHRYSTFSFQIMHSFYRSSPFSCHSRVGELMFFPYFLDFRFFDFRFVIPFFFPLPRFPFHFLNVASSNHQSLSFPEGSRSDMKAANSSKFLVVTF
jgi:hypothetical protein